MRRPFVLLVAILLLSAPNGAAAFGISSLEDVAGSMAGQLRTGFENSVGGSGKPIVFIGGNYFVDTRMGNAYPFSGYFSEALRHAMTLTGRFAMTDDQNLDTDYYLSGSYYRENGRLVITCNLKGFKIRDDSMVQSRIMVDVASGQEELKQKYWGKDWFEDSIKDRMHYLMNRLEAESLNKIGRSEKPFLVINPFRSKNTSLFSPLSDYLRQFAMDYFTGSSLLVPQADTRDRMRDVQNVRFRHILPTANKNASLAAASGGECFLAGNYWPVSDTEIEVWASLGKTSENSPNTNLAAESIRIPKSMIPPDMLVIPQESDPKFMADHQALLPENPDAPLMVELLTQKGRDNLSFKMGESIVFYLKTNRKAYVRLFNRAPDGLMYQIYPNVFADGTKPLPANILTAVPNLEYDPAFRFDVTGEMGNELVILYASDKPLPELGSIPSQFFGVKQMLGTPAQIRDEYTQYAATHGIFLTRDMLAIRTLPAGGK